MPHSMNPKDLHTVVTSQTQISDVHEQQCTPNPQGKNVIN